MNHTMITAAIVTILATLVAGSGAFTTTAQSADAYNKDDHNGIMLLVTHKREPV
jgi:uncharacterized membrane protein